MALPTIHQENLHHQEGNVFLYSVVTEWQGVQRYITIYS